MAIDTDAIGAALHAALRARQPIAPLKARHPEMTITDAYRASEALLARRLADGEAIIGRKIGVTSPAVQQMLGVHQPDFGTLTDAMLFGATVPISELLIQPRAEGEIAFKLGRDLSGPAVTPADVLAATETIHPCFEIVDSRIADWKIGIEDTVADNASSGVFNVGPGRAPAGFDFEGCQMRVSKNGAPLSAGFGRAALGSPLNAVAWLANTLGGFGVPLRAGEWVLSGSLVPLEPVHPGDSMRVEVDGMAPLDIHFR